MYPRDLKIAEYKNKFITDLKVYAQLKRVKIDISVLKVTKTVLMIFGFHCDADLDINLTQPKQNLGFF